MIHRMIFCEICDRDVPVLVDEVQTDDFDLVCGLCRLVIGTGDCREQISSLKTAEVSEEDLATMAEWKRLDEIGRENGRQR